MPDDESLPGGPTPPPSTSRCRPPGDAPRGSQSVTSRARLRGPLTTGRSVRIEVPQVRGCVRSSVIVRPSRSIRRRPSGHRSDYTDSSPWASHIACRWCRSRPPGSTATRSNRSGSRGTGEPSGSVPRSSRPYAAARTRTRLRWSTVSSAQTEVAAGAPADLDDRRAPRVDPGRPPRGRSRGGRHGRSGPGRSSRRPSVDPRRASRRHRPPAGPRSARDRRVGPPWPHRRRRRLSRHVSGRIRRARSAPARRGRARRASSRRP